MRHRRHAGVKSLSLVIICAALWLGAAAEAAHAAPLTFTVTVNTASLSGASGFLNLQFNPGGAGAQTATLRVNDLMLIGGTTLASTAEVIGNVTGVLPGAVTIANSTSFNDLFQRINFGSGFSFDITLLGAELDAPSNGNLGSSFGLSLFAADAVTPLLTTDRNGTLLTIQVNPNGTTSVRTFGDGAGGGSVVTVAAPVPEPATLMLSSIGCAGLATVLRRKRKREAASFQLRGREPGRSTS